MKNLLKVFAMASLAICFQCKEVSRNFCGNTKRHDLSEINKMAIYNRTASVKIGSFKNLDKVPITDGRLDVTKFVELHTLSTEDQNESFDVLVNYNYSFANRDTVKSTVIFCDDPRNAIVFLDSQDSVIGYIELSFPCFKKRVVPAEFNVGEFCDEKFAVLRELFERNNVEFGLAPTSDEEQQKNLADQLKKRPENPVALLALASIRVDEGKFSEAIALLDKSIGMDSTKQQAYFLRGHARLESTDYVGAVSDFSRVIEIVPRSTGAYYQRALAYIGIYETNPSKDLLTKVCADLLAASESGDSSLVVLRQRFCGN